MPPGASTIAATLRQLLPADPRKRIYGIVDAARCVDLAFEAQIHFGVRILSLFRPEVQARLWDVAPYLVPIEPGSEYLENWGQRWGGSAGVLLVADADEARLYEHLRNVFVVEDEQKQEFFLRFYDPRVLRVFLPTCSSAEVVAFFGPVTTFILESDSTDTLICFGHDAGALQTREVVLPHAEKQPERDKTIIRNVT
jgi:hypothetical protein